MKIALIKTAALSLAFTSFAYACDCGCKDKHAKKETKAAKEVVITGNDTMQFDKKAIELKAGEATKIIFKNVGTLPKAAMGHNLVILKPGSDAAAFGRAAIAAKDTEYIPQDDANKALVVGHTKILGPGEEGSFIVTLEAGEYPFVCSFPGHSALMKGVITVK